MPLIASERLAFDGLGQGGAAFVLHPSLSACAIDRVAVGAEHVLALSSRGQIWSWGSNRFGQLGQGTRGEHATQPSVVLGALAGRRVLDVSAGAFHSLAAVERGFHSREAAEASGRSQRTFTAAEASASSAACVFSWGFGGDSALGHGREADEFRPRAVLRSSEGELLTGVRTVAAGWRHSLALTRQGILWAWGHGDSGQLGVQGRMEAMAPVSIASFDTATGTTVWKGSCPNMEGESHVPNMEGEPHVPNMEASQLRLIAAGDQYSVAVDAHGRVWQWGCILGAGRESFPTACPRRMHLPLPEGEGHDDALRPPGTTTRVRSIAAGAAHVIALTWDGHVYTWGQGRSGSLGHGDERDLRAPALVSMHHGLPVQGITSISAGANHSLAMRASLDGSGEPVMWAWGHTAALVRRWQPCDVGAPWYEGTNVPEVLFQMKEQAGVRL